MRHLLLAALLGGALPVCAQMREAPKATTPEKAFIEVTGTASREVVPDRIFLAIVLKSLPTDKPAHPVPQQEAELRSILAQQGLSPTLLTLTDASSELLTRRRKAPGAEVRKEYQLQLASAGQLTSVVQALQATGISETSVERTEYSQLESLQKEVRIAALRAARDKATYLLQAIGEQPDRPLEIREIPAYQGSRAALFSNSVLTTPDDSPAGEENAPPPVQFASIKVSFSYHVRYGLK